MTLTERLTAALEGRWFAVRKWFRRCPECLRRGYGAAAPRWEDDKIAQMLGIVQYGCPCCGKGAMREAERKAPSYHDLHITTAHLPRTSIFDLPYGYEVICTRVGGWVLWHNQTKVAGEYDEGLRLDVAGYAICDSLTARAAALGEEVEG